MTLTIIILSCLLLLSGILHLSYFSKLEDVKELKNSLQIEMKLFKEQLELKRGYYVQELTTTNKPKKDFKVKVYIKEVDQYTNGKSKIAITSIGKCSLPDGITQQKINAHIYESFDELRDSKDIEWLESTNEIQKIREKKLSRVMKFFKQN